MTSNSHIGARVTHCACIVFLYSYLSAFAQEPASAPPSEPPPSSISIARAQHLVQTGHIEQALRELDELAEATPPQPGLQRLRGDAFYALGKLKEADSAFALALVSDPKDAEAAQMRALTLFRLGRPADAIPLLEKTPGTNLQNKADPSYVLALCYIDTRRYDDARHAFATQYGFVQDSASAYLLAARMLLRREYVPVAQKFAARALELDPNLPLANELLGEIALAGNHYDEAAGFFEKELARNPLEPSAYERLGDTYTRAARYPEARRVLQQAVLLEPNSTGPYILLGKVTLKENDPVASLTYLQRAEQMDPANYITHNLLAQAYRSLGRTADAARELQLTEKSQAADAPKLSTAQ